MEKQQLKIKQPSSDFILSDDLCVFNGFQFPLLQDVTYFSDGLPGCKVMFLTGRDEIFTISFEEDMECMDLKLSDEKRYTSNHCEYQQNNKYLHQLKLVSNEDNKMHNFVYFRMEVTDEDGTVYTCPGQMFMGPAFKQSSGVEPILLELIDGLSIYHMKGCKGW